MNLVLNGFGLWLGPSMAMAYSFGHNGYVYLIRLFKYFLIIYILFKESY